MRESARTVIGGILFGVMLALVGITAGGSILWFVLACFGLGLSAVLMFGRREDYRRPFSRRR